MISFGGLFGVYMCQGIFFGRKKAKRNIKKQQPKQRKILDTENKGKESKEEGDEECQRRKPGFKVGLKIFRCQLKISKQLHFEAFDAHLDDLKRHRLSARKRQ